MAFYGGVEGGGTNTTIVILNNEGKVVAETKGPGSNGYLIGVPAAADVLLDLFHKAKTAAGIPLDKPLASVGACMSGFMEAGPQNELIANMVSKDPHLAAGPGAFYVDNDSPGSVFTAAGSAGGAVIIAGTGTMGQLILPVPGSDGELKLVSCGGHGHMYGDEGSAYYIASEAIRRIHRADDGFSDDASGSTGLPDVSRARSAMHRYFAIDNNEGMLDVMYKTFTKAKVAGFTKTLAGLARGGADSPDGNSAPDAFCGALFTLAGTLLGCKARALAPHALPAGAAAGARDVRDFTIVAVGSVWYSWDLMKESFIAAATAPFHMLPAEVLDPQAVHSQAAKDASSTGRRLPRVNVTHLPANERGRLVSFKIVRLKVTSAVGSAWRGAQLKAGVQLPLDSEANCETLYSHSA